MNSKSVSKTNIGNDEKSNSSYDTLKENFSEIAFTEDITVFCDLCKEYFYYGEIKYHRQIHNCLSIMQIDDMNSLTFKNLAKRRHKLKQQIRFLPPDQRKNLQPKLDSAYSTIYNYLIENHHQENFTSGFSEKTENHHSIRDMQDKFEGVINEYLENYSNSMFEAGYAIKTYCNPKELSIALGKISENDTFFSLITGKDGDCAQKFVSTNAVEYLISNLSDQNDKNKLNKFQEILKKLPIALDKSLRTGLYDNVTFNRWSSCTVESVTLSKSQEDRFIISAMNIGDGIIILVHVNDFEILSTKHSLENPTEVKRIRDLGGSISLVDDKAFLCGITSQSQVIGGYGNSRIKAFQLPDPNVITVEIDSNNINEYLGIIIINSNVANLITVQDAVEIFKNETFSQSRFSKHIEIEEDLQKLSLNSLDVLEPILPISDSCDNKEVINTHKRSIYQSKTIARKIVNAAILNQKYQTCCGAMAFVFRNEYFS